METTPHKNVEPLLIQDEMKECYLDYAMSVIVGRALPDIRDGLKPVHRRILFSMHQLNNYHSRPYLKSARVVGDVIGKYHPHGDSAVYAAIVRLAQDFSMRYPIVDGQGNFGSIDGDSAAAMRYTEIRLKKIAEELLDDIDKDTIDWGVNYDGSLKEPTVLPTKVPNLLVNGSTGIAVGMSTNIPPHNITEVVDGLIETLDNPDVTIADLIRIIPGPDFPTAGSIMGMTGIHSAYNTGKGIIQIRAKADIEELNNDRQRIIITEIPYQVNKAKVVEKIAELVNEKSITGISDIRDESNREGIRVVIDIKRGEQAQVILNNLYKHTQLQVSFGIIFLAILNGQPKLLNLKEMLQSFIDHRREIIVRRALFELNKAKERAHILEGLKIAVENIDEVIQTIKTSDSPSEAKQSLIQRFILSEVQSQAILDLRLQKLTGLERDKIIEEHKEVLGEIAKIEELLASETLIKDVIRSEFFEIKKAYGDERRTSIVPLEDEVTLEDLIKNEEVIVTITHKGYLKRMATDTYKAQKRGGKGVKSGVVDEDFYTNIFVANTHDTLIFFTDKGTVFSLKVYNIPEASRTSKGKNIINLINLPEGEKVKEIITMPKDKEEKVIIIATQSGIIKKSDLMEYKNIKQSGLKAIRVIDGDSVVSVRISDGKKDILMCSSSGKSIRFPEEDLRSLGRVSQGVKGMSLDDGERIIGMELVDDSVEILSVTSRGYGKRTPTTEYRKQSRGGKGILAMKSTDKNGDLVKIKPVTDKDDLVIITDKGQVIRTKIQDIALIGRNTQGVKILNTREDETVVAVENFIDSDEETE